MDSVFVVWGGAGVMARGRAWWGAACAPLHPTLLYTHLAPSSLRFRLGSAVIFKTYEHHLVYFGQTADGSTLPKHTARGRYCYSVS